MWSHFSLYVVYAWALTNVDSIGWSFESVNILNFCYFQKKKIHLKSGNWKCFLYENLLKTPILS